MTFEEVFKKHYQSLVLYAISFVGDKKLAEDIVQTLFTKLWNNNQFATINYHQAYLYNATRNACIDHKRLKIRHSPFLENNTELSSTDDTEQQEADDERIACLYKIIDDFPPKCKAIFFKVCIEEKSYSETAQLMGISSSMVKKQIVKAYRLIREKYRYSG